MSRLVPALVVIAAALLAGCGSGKDDAGATRAPLHGVAGPESRPQARTQTAPPAMPSPQATPRSSSRPVRAADSRVIGRWAARLRHGDVTGAAALFAVNTRAQNGTPLIVLKTAKLRREFNAGFTCGAVPTHYARGQQGFTIVSFRLVERPGGSCASAVGAKAQSAIRVRNGRITDWIRLENPGGQGGGGTAPETSSGAASEA